jgi:hypothetical protein
LPTHLVDESPSIAIAGVVPRGGVEEAVARHSLRGGSCSSAPDARNAASTLKSPASVLENLATVWLRTCLCLLGDEGSKRVPLGEFRRAI